MRERGLQRVEAVVQRQQGVPPEGDDDRLVQRLLSYRKGLAMLRDYEGRVAPIRIDPGPRLLEDLDTTPGGGTDGLAA